MMLGSWPDLPDAPLAAAGPDSQALLAAGCDTYRSAGRWLCGLPYGRNSDRADYRRVLSERRGTCSTKHALLAAVAREQRLPVSLRVGIYDLCEANTPGVGGVLAVHGLDSLPEAHCYLGCAGRRIDVTRADARPTASIAFHREWDIEPRQIGAEKERIHREFLAVWLARRPELDLELDEIWRVREACIAALASG